MATHAPTPAPPIGRWEGPRPGQIRTKFARRANPDPRARRPRWGFAPGMPVSRAIFFGAPIGLPALLGDFSRRASPPLCPSLPREQAFRRASPLGRYSCTPRAETRGRFAFKRPAAPSRPVPPCGRASRRARIRAGEKNPSTPRYTTPCGVYRGAALVRHVYPRVVVHPRCTVRPWGYTWCTSVGLKEIEKVIQIRRGRAMGARRSRANAGCARIRVRAWGGAGRHRRDAIGAMPAPIDRPHCPW